MALVLIALQVAFRTWAVSGGWFLLDDYQFLSTIARGQDDLDWYLRSHQGHFMPLSFSLVKLVSLAGAYSWTAVTVEVAVLQLLASLAAWWMLRTIFGLRPAAVTLLALYLFLPVTIPSVMWWAVAINQLPHQIALCLLLGAHVQYLRTRRLRWLALSLAAILVGYASYTKIALALPLLALLPLMWFTTGSLGRRILAALRTWWPAWVTHGVLALAYVAIYLNQDGQQSFGHADGGRVELAYTFLVRNLAPTLVGGPLNWWLYRDTPISYVDPSEAVVVIAWVALAAVVAIAFLARERALRALWLPATYVGISIVLVAVGRGVVIGLMGARSTGEHLQYLSDAAPVLVLGLGGLFLAVPGAVESSALRRDPLLTRLPGPRLVAAGLVAVLAASAVSTVRYVQPWHDDFPGRAFVTQGWASLEGDSPVADDVVPAEVMSPLFGEFTRLRNYFSPFGDVPVQEAGVDLNLLDLDGNPVPALVDGEPRSTREPERCAYEASDGEPVTIPIVPIIDSVFWMQVDYSTLVPGDVAVVTGGQRTGVRLEAGEHRLLVRTTDAYDEVTIYPAERQVLCVSAVRVGSLSPEEDAS